MTATAEWAALWLSLRAATSATAWLLPIGFAIAYGLARFRFPGRSLLNALVHLPLLLPPVVTGWALLAGFGANGPIGRLLAPWGIRFAFDWTGAALAAGVMALPLMVRPIRQALEAVDPRLEQAAETLGASPWRRLRTVTLPLAMPGVLAGTALAFAKAFGEFGATITFVGAIPGETRTLPIAIYAALQTPGGETAALHASLLAAGVAVAALAASEWLAAVQTRGSGRRG